MTTSITQNAQPNALSLPWIPVVLPTGEQITLGLMDLFGGAHEIAALGSPLTPLDRDTLMRFLPSVAALVLREIEDEDARLDVGDTGQFPADAVNAFADRWEDFFHLTHLEHPFLQRWDVHRGDLDALVSKAKMLIHADPAKAILKPLEQMHPHAPGGSSAHWAIRRDPRDPANDRGALLSCWP
ncbi:MAG: type I-E CRISPR-associated protein Cse1/CasA [Nocardioidaceae bacterium]